MAKVASHKFHARDGLGAGGAAVGAILPAERHFVAFDADDARVADGRAVDAGAGIMVVLI